MGGIRSGDIPAGGKKAGDTAMYDIGVSASCSEALKFAVGETDA